jgi:hypothetical protein
VEKGIEDTATRRTGGIKSRKKFVTSRKRTSSFLYPNNYHPHQMATIDSSGSTYSSNTFG